MQNEMTAGHNSEATPPTPKPQHLPASPHGEILPVFDGVWFVRGGIKMPMMMPMKIGRSMTIVEGPPGELTRINTMRLSDAGLEALDALGTVKHVLRLAGFHGRDDGFYRERYGARVWAIEGQRYLRGLGKDVPPFMQADVYLTERSPMPIPFARLKVFPSSDPPEAVCLLERDGGILITGDSLQHTPAPDEFFNLPEKFMMKRMGFLKPYNVGPGWLQFAHPTAADVRSLLALEFRHVLPGHGHAVIDDAREKFRPAIEGELKGCHA